MVARLSLLVAAVTAGLTTSCRHPAPAVAATGSASFSVVERAPVTGTVRSSTEPNTDATRAEYREPFLAARPTLPVYPARALAAKAGDARIGVRLAIDTQGRVAGISASMRTPTIVPPGFADEFRDAVETAVQQWKFQAARIEYVETVTERGITFERLKRWEPQEAELDLVFEFTAKGGVAAGK